jgi:hypothetical protein
MTATKQSIQLNPAAAAGLDRRPPSPKASEDRLSGCAGLAMTRQIGTLPRGPPFVAIPSGNSAFCLNLDFPLNLNLGPQPFLPRAEGA